MSGERVLVVDDEPIVTEVVQRYLIREGYKASVAADGRSALKEAREGSPDLVVLDLMLPTLPGTEVARILRQDEKTRAIPIIMLTARGSEIDRIVGFELGADDYVVKPFSPRELVLRIQAILRREGREESEERIIFEPLVIDLAAHAVRLKGREIDLTATEFKLLHRLARRPGRAFSRDQLLSDVWGYSGDLETRTVDTHMKRLRAKLGVVGAWIETVRGHGYRFRPEGFAAAD
jgi:two-component system, OmpR family, phosphate regulon response regulator PhoB